MAARMIDLLVNRPDSYFFAFGAGHFLGKNSILDYLEQAGFTVDHIGPEDYVDFRYACNCSILWQIDFHPDTENVTLPRTYALSC